MVRNPIRLQDLCLRMERAHVNLLVGSRDLEGALEEVRSLRGRKEKSQAPSDGLRTKVEAAEAKIRAALKGAKAALIGVDDVLSEVDVAYDACPRCRRESEARSEAVEIMPELRRDGGTSPSEATRILHLLNARQP
jgi:hypothetical protein